MDNMKHFKYTYEKSGAHHQEPPPTGIVQFDVQTENRS